MPTELRIIYGYIGQGFADCVEFAAKNNMTLSGAISTSFGCPFIGKVPVEMVENAEFHGSPSGCPTVWDGGDKMIEF